MTLILKKPDDEYALPPALVPFAIRSADEGIPVTVIARILRQPSEIVRESLHDALQSGAIAEMPRDDWPPTAKRGDRVPTESPIHLPDEVVHVTSMKIFRLTPVQAALFVVLLKRNEASKGVLHGVIEHRRMTRAQKPVDLEETDLKMVDVVVCHLRTKLKQFKLEIKTIRAHGFFMEREDRKRAMSAIREAAVGVPVWDSTRT